MLGLEDTLRVDGYDVEVGTNGVNASRRALKRSFDLILLGVMLPGKDGFEICVSCGRAPTEKAPNRTVKLRPNTARSLLRIEPVRVCSSSFRLGGRDVSPNSALRADR